MTKKDQDDFEKVLLAARKLALDRGSMTGLNGRKIANYLSKLGDTFLCFENSEHTYSGRIMYNFTDGLYKLDTTDFANRRKFGVWFNKPIFLAIFCYRISEELIREEHPMLASQRLMKILYIIKDHITLPNKVARLDTVKVAYLALLQEVLVRPILVLMNKANEGTRRLSVQQFKINACLPFQRI